MEPLIFAACIAAGIMIYRAAVLPIFRALRALTGKTP